MKEKDLIRIQWHVDQSGEVPKYSLICQHPDHQDLYVETEASEKMTERTAKAFLMQKMYEMGKERGIEPKYLRFKINGIEE
jgi:hypothetical protein